MLRRRGGQHACLVADALGMETVFIHPYAGVLSAYGMGLADQSAMREQAVEKTLSAGLMPELDALADATRTAGARGVAGAGRRTRLDRAHQHAAFALRRHRGRAARPIARSRNGDARLHRGASRAVRLRHARAATDRRAGVGRGHRARRPGARDHAAVPRIRAPDPIDIVSLFTLGRDHAARVFERTGLRAGDTIPGPALIREANATTVIEPGWTAEVTALDHMILRRAEAAPERVPANSGRPDPVLLELFNNLFMSVAEQTGAVLQNTSLSVNIKERLDFSCAIFDADGRLVANAPHVPVHLGAMGESVRTVMRDRGATLKPGDVVALNNPFNGGTHLPDVTVITPVFDDSGRSFSRRILISL